MESRAFSYLDRAAENLKYQIGKELEYSKREVLNIIDINKTKMIEQIQRGKPRETGATGSGKRLKKINIQEGIRKSKAEKHVITEDNFNNNYLKRI